MTVFLLHLFAFIDDLNIVQNKKIYMYLVDTLLTLKKYIKNKMKRNKSKTNIVKKYDSNKAKERGKKKDGRKKM